MCIRDSHLGIGLGLSFSYILFQTITSTFAVNGNVPPVIAAVSYTHLQTFETVTLIYVYLFYKYIN